VTEKHSTDLFYELRKTESQRQSQKWKTIRQNPSSRCEQQVQKDVTQDSRTWEKTKEELQGETKRWKSLFARQPTCSVNAPIQ
jgi:hypothetical protein